MKQTVVIAAALSLGMLTGCSREKQDPAAQAPPPVQVESEGGVSLIAVDHPERSLWLPPPSLSRPLH